MPVKYFYTLSSTHRDKLELSYANYTRWSIRSLCKVVDNPEVIICFTPPVDPADVESLKQYNPYVRENTPAKVRHPGIPSVVTSAKIMNKVHVGEVEGERVVLPDTNVIFIKDPAPLLEDEFDIAGNVLEDKKYDFWFISCRFIIFKNNVQGPLAAKWLKEYNDGEYSGDIERGLYNAAISLGLTIKNINKEMDEYVYHTHGGYRK